MASLLGFQLRHVHVVGRRLAGGAEGGGRGGGGDRAGGARHPSSCSELGARILCGQPCAPLLASVDWPGGWAGTPSLPMPPTSQTVEAAQGCSCAACLQCGISISELLSFGFSIYQHLALRASAATCALWSCRPARQPRTWGCCWTSRSSERQPPCACSGQGPDADLLFCCCSCWTSGSVPGAQRMERLLAASQVPRAPPGRQRPAPACGA